MPKTQQPPENKTLPQIDKPLDEALFDGLIEGTVASIYQDERPLVGLAGLLDWRMQGFVSDCIREGVISGRPGECSYIPFSRHGRTFHLILVGAGISQAHGRRTELPEASLDILKKNLKSLGRRKVALSKSDMGNPSNEFFEKHFREIPVLIVP